MNSSGRSYARLSRRSFLGACLVGLSVAPGCVSLSRPKKIDAAVYEPAVAKTTRQVAEEIARLSVLNEGKKPKICFIGVLGDSAVPISNATREKLEKSKEFNVVDEKKMQAAFKKSKISRSDVFRPQSREKFADALGESFDYILAGYVEDREERVDPNDEESKTIPKTVYRLSLFNLDTNAKSDFVAEL
ncbi:MAG: hypothetical protein J6X44_08640 [Thermoguttaceae bacterium]|nr:hypothetical protein [Thermoguttaceae bacterium]